MTTEYLTFNSDLAVSNYQVEFTLTTNSGANSGFTLNLGGKCLQSGFIDLRFCDLSGNILPHYILHNESAVRCFVKVNLMVGINIIVINYGDMSWADIQDGTNTFVLFDKFTNLDNWNLSGTVSVAGGICSINGSITSVATLPSGTVVEVNMKSTKVTTAKLVLQMLNGTNYSMLDLVANLYKNVVNNVLTSTTPTTITASTWYTIKYANGKWYVNGTLDETFTDLLYGKIAFYAASMDLHWLIARKYSAAVLSAATYSLDYSTLTTVYRHLNETQINSDSSIDDLSVCHLTETNVQSDNGALCQILRENSRNYQPDPDHVNYIDEKGRISVFSINGFTTRMKTVIAAIIPTTFVSFLKVDTITVLYERYIMRDTIEQYE